MTNNADRRVYNMEYRGGRYVKIASNYQYDWSSRTDSALRVFLLLCLCFHTDPLDVSGGLCFSSRQPAKACLVSFTLLRDMERF